MEPQFRFCTSADGTRIAYSTYGDPVARALVFVKNFDRAQEYWWKYEGSRALNEGLASSRRVVTFDRRGVGDSQRDVNDLAMLTQVADLAAVVEHIGLESFDLLGQVTGAALAVAYATEHPERVGRFVLLRPFMRTLGSPPQGLKGMAQAIRANWPIARRSMATFAIPNGPTEAQRSYSNMLRDSVAPEVAARHLEVVAEYDCGAILGDVQAPTLVLSNSRAHPLEIASVRAAASLIPDARFLTYKVDVESQTDSRQLMAAIRGFLNDEDAESQDIESQPATGSFATILFTDMQSSTVLTRQLGDAAAQDVRRTHNEIVRSALTANGGSEVKHTGDGIMASFATASSALNCAIAIQQGVAAHKEAQPDSPLGVYIGLNAGEPIAEDDDLFGTSVDLAARICDHAEPGQIVASDVVRQLAAGKDFLFADLGETELRGFEDPVKLWEVRWTEEA